MGPILQQALHSVGRQAINIALLDLVNSKGNIAMFFNHSLTHVSPLGHVELLDQISKISVKKMFDLVIGADGNFTNYVLQVVY
jgi:2-polyprenyl-6-methoxyphenol hydroxylase-like FAD-dependent oxidoreductase